MKKLHGVIPPMITPFDAQGNLDEQSLLVLLDFLLKHVDGVFINGSYGACAMMSIAERKRVAEITTKAANGKTQVIVMVGTANTRDAIELAKHANSIGADAIAAIAPYYFKHNSDDLKSFFGDLVSVSKLPVYIYNNPSFQGYPIDMPTMQALKSIGVAGVKDATFDIIMHANYQRLLQDQSFDVVLGTEAMWLPAAALGCQAFIPGIGNVFPEICQTMYQQAMATEYLHCRKTQFCVNRIREIMYLAKSTQLAIYAMLEIRKIIKSYPRAPFVPASEEEKAKIKASLIELGMI